MADPSSLLVGVGPGAIAALPPGADPEIFDHGDGVEQYTGLRHIANQGRALTVKSLLVLRRRKKSTAAYVLMPSLAILALWGVIAGVSAWLDPSTSAAHKNYPLVPLRVRKCEVFDGNNLATGAPCTTAMFAPDSPNTVAIMRKFAAATGLVYGTDVVAASSAQAIAHAIAHYPGSVDAAVVFTEPGGRAGGGSPWAPAAPPAAAQLDGSGAPTLEYQLWTNTTGNMGRWLTGDERHLLDQAGVYGHYEAVLQALDAAIIGHVSGLDASAEIQVAVGKFAELASSLPHEGTSCLENSSVGCSPPHLRDLITWMFGDLGLVLGTSFTALMVLYTISSEKEAKMLAALRTVGLREWLFWTSWALAYFVLGIFGAALSTTVGSTLNLRMFVQCSWLVQFLAALLFMQSFAAQAIFLASFVTRGRYIITSSVLLLVVVFGVCSTLKSLAVAGLHYRYGADSDWLSWSLASIQPWFHYMRIELAILATIYPTAHLRDNELMRALEDPEAQQGGTHFFSFGHLANATVYNTIDHRWSPVKSVEYTTGTSLWAMVFLSFFYYWLAWYFGQVSSPDEGSHEGCCFCFSPNYWGVRRQQALVMDDDDSIGLEKSRSMLDRSVRTYKLSKAYKEEMAVSEVTLEIESSCCLALLGTNGAGKSTFISILTGIHSPTHGEAFIFGLDVKADMAKLQKIMGCCPQEDLLWAELTAREHLHLYARFKGIADDVLQQHCTDILTSVGLVADADNTVSTYSGGMKRRLSVGIASVASPTIMFLDEPSTGMDPLSKRRVWTMIEQLKKNRVMLLTTHSMEEADALGDKVAILDKGRLRAIGSSLFLKRTYGKGHTISLLSEVDDAPRVEQLVKSCIPSAEILGTAAGNTSVSIQRSAVQGIPRLFNSLMAEDGLIKEWGLSDTTLEEVFLRLAAQNREVNAEIEGQDQGEVGRVMLVRSSTGASTGLANPELVAVLEAANPSSIVVVGPEGSGLEIVADTGRAEAKRYVCVAQGGAVIQAGADTETDECGRISQFDEIVALDEVCLPTGVRRVQCDKGWVSTTGTDGVDVLQEVTDGTVLASIDRLVIPDASSKSLPMVQMIDMTVPADSHGHSVRIEIGGKTVTVEIPPDAEPGARIQVPVPLPQLQEGVRNSMFSDHSSVETVSIVQQTFAVVWKNAVLAFGCRKGPGCRGLMNCKCCELFCYISLFIVMAMVAIVHIWIVRMIGGMQRDMLNADHEYFCEDGVVHVTWGTGSGWAPATEDCPYRNDGECDEPYNCPLGSDVGDCPAVESELSALQFSSCDRAAVASEMLNLSTRAQVPLPLTRSVGELDLLRRREHQTWTSACNDNDRSRAGGACWADLVAVNSRSLFRRPGYNEYGGSGGGGWGSCSLQSVANEPTCAGSNWSSLNSSCMPGADIWYSSPQRLTFGRPPTSFSELSLLPDNGINSGMSWAQQSPGYLTMLGLSDLQDHTTVLQDSSLNAFSTVREEISMRFREVEAGSVNERVLAAQAYNRDHRAQNAECAATGSACAGHVHTDHQAGWFSSDGYADSADCQWLLTCPSAASVITLTFSSFSTESSFDFVRVYDDGNQMHMLLSLDGEYGDASPHAPVTSSGGIMLVRLTSDSSVSKAGFHAEFQCSEPGSPTANATVQYTAYSDASTTVRQVQFSSAEEADAWFRDSFPAFALEVDQSLIADSSVTFRYGVRQWTAHAYQAYPFLTTASSACGQDRCQLDRDIELVSPSSDTCADTSWDACVRETKAGMTLRSVISGISNAVLRTRLGMRNASLTATIVPMPEFKYWQTNRRPDDSLALWLVMYPLLTMLLIPTLGAMLASEKEKGLMDMVKMEGGRTISFLLGNWLFVFAYSLMFNVLFVLTIAFSGAADGDSGVQMPGYRVAALLLLWAHAQTGFVHFIGLCMFRKARHAALFGAFAMIIAVMAGFTVTLMEAEHMITSDFFPLSCLLIPPLAYTRTVGVLLWYGGGEEFDRGLTMLMVDGLLYLLLAVGYLLWPTEDVRQLLARLVRSAKARVLAGTAAAELPLVNVVSTGGGTPFQSEDESVVAERYRTSAAAIRIEGLVKDYSAVSGGKELTKRAINELFLSIERNEIFGLLGPNGAGKTSLIQILTGMTPPTAGSASVCGFDINTHMDCVKRVIGVCPQFDVLWEDMTVRQHLVFYSMLRGLPRSRIKVEARRLAEKMELDGDVYNKLASALSGGAKRRLSIAIALAGRPPCLFFDEPTTGLDPETRRQIWGIIKAEQRDNAIVITTHSMEEADALCSRIGIMAGGSLRAIGSQNYLKSRFGDGFKVTLNCVDESKRRLRRVNDFIMSLSSNAQFVSRFGAHLTYTVPMAGGDVALIFNQMERSKRELGVVEWGVTQASLEEVFIKVVLQWEEGVHGQSSRNAFANPLSGVGGAIASSSDEED